MRSFINLLGTPALLLFAVVHASAANASNNINSFPPLDEYSSYRLAVAAAERRPMVAIPFLTRTGALNSVVDLIHRVHGEIAFLAPDVDFGIAILSTKDVAELLSSPLITAVSVEPRSSDSDEVVWFDVTPRQVSNVAAGKAAAPKVDSYQLAGDMDGERFRGHDYRFDGRGIVIAQIEDFPDLIGPEFQRAYSFDGTPIRKFYDIVNVPEIFADTNPANRDWRWVSLEAARPGPHGYVTIDKRTFRVARSGAYQVGTLRMPAAVSQALGLHAAQPGADVAADFPVLWEPATKTAILDINGDDDFSNDVPVRTFRESGEIGLFGPPIKSGGRPALAGFAVQFDAGTKHLSFNFGISRHATMTAGVAAASAKNGGKVDGIAPGAQLMPIAVGRTTGSFARAMITAFRDENVNVVFVEGRGGTTHQSLPNDGRSLLGQLLQRLVKRYPKPTFVTATNQIALGTVIDLGMGEDIVAVNSSHSRISVKKYYSLDLDEDQTLHFNGSAGPGGNGSLKPDLLASVVTVAPTFPSSEDLANDVAPPGYALSGGTSAAAPIAAGAAALLIGAAKLSGKSFDNRAFLSALRSSAKFLPRIGANQQGHGLLQIDSAWRTLTQAPGLDAPDISISGPVNTLVSHTLDPPNAGPGLFEREGWRAGDRGQRALTIVRTSGPPEPIRVELDWQGDVSVFKSVGSIDLPLNLPVTILVEVGPTLEGVNSALLNISYRGQFVRAAMATIIAAPDVTRSGESRQFKLRPAGRESRFFRIPPGSDAVRFQLQAPTNDALAEIRSSSAARQGGLVRPDELGKADYTFESPEPGVWEVAVSDPSALQRKRRTNSSREAKLSVGSIRADFYQLRLGTKVAGSQVGVAARNEGAEVKGYLESGPLLAFSTSEEVVRFGAPKERTLQVGASARAIWAEVVGEDLDAIDLHVFRCSAAKCERGNPTVRTASSLRFYQPEPSGRTWRFIVSQNRRRPPSQVEIRYGYTDPKFGEVRFDSVNSEHSSGSTWKEAGQCRRNRPPPDGMGIGIVAAFIDQRLQIQRRVHDLRDSATRAEVARLGLTVTPIESSSCTASH